MVANGTQVYESNTPVRDAIAAGEIDVGLINHYYVAQAKAEDPDYPVEVYFPPDDLGSLVNITGVGVLASSDEPDDAFDFVRFLLSQAVAAVLRRRARRSTRSSRGRARPDAGAPLAEIPHRPTSTSRASPICRRPSSCMQETGAL